MSNPGNQGGASLHGVAFRAVQLNFNGSHVGNLVYVTNNLMKLDFNPELEAGTEVADKAADGSVFVSYLLQDVQKRYTVTLEIVANDPQLEALLTGGTALVSGGSGVVNVRGYQDPPLNAVPNPNGIGLEVWTHNIVNGQIDAIQPFQRHIFPAMFLHKGNRTIDLNRMASPFDGFSSSNQFYGTGPAGDIPAAYTTTAHSWIYDTAIPAIGLGYSVAAN